MLIIINTPLMQMHNFLLLILLNSKLVTKIDLKHAFHISSNRKPYKKKYIIQGYVNVV